MPIKNPALNMNTGVINKTSSKLIYSTKCILVWVLICVLTSCQSVSTEGELTDNSNLTPVSTTTGLILWEEEPENDFEDNLIVESHTNILAHYYEVIADPNLPVATRVFLEEIVSTIEAQVTSISEPYPTYSPPDVDHKATLEIIWELTATSQPTPIPEFGIIRKEPYAQTTFPRRDDIWIEDAWRGYITGDTKLRVVRIGSFREGTLDNPTYYGLVHLHGDYMEDVLYLTDVPQRNLSLIAVINDQYLIMEALDNDALGTGKMYYFDMVAREFMSQTTAELQISNFPLQAEATPTPPIAVTIPPAQPQHPRQP